MNHVMQFIYYFNIFCMVYTLALSALYILQLILSYIKMSRDKKNRPANDYGRYASSANLPPVSLIVPAHNEQVNIANNVRELLQLNYPQFELIVVNDGSTDGTHEEMLSAFGLAPIDHAFKISIPIRKIRGVYANPDYPSLLYVDKAQGGKSDALNAGINLSSFPLFVCLDADSRPETDAVLRLAVEFIRDSATIVAGGFVRIANGTAILEGEARRFEMPPRRVERFQIVEYLRAFLSGRVSWGVTGSMLVVSGAFGLFNKRAVIECGGYKNDTVGEDMEIIVRLHHYLRRRRQKYRMIFREDAVCWTQGPMSFHDLRSQRRRWQIGLMDSLLSHAPMTLNPRYGTIGLFAIPYHWLFEWLGALVEVMGYVIIPLSLILGILSIQYFLLYLLLATGLGVILSLGGILLEQMSGRSCLSSGQYLALAKYAVLENLGYRQYVSLCRAEGILRYGQMRNSWGKIKRESFNTR